MLILRVRVWRDFSRISLLFSITFSQAFYPSNRPIHPPFRSHRNRWAITVPYSTKLGSFSSGISAFRASYVCARQYLHNVAPLKGRKRPACALITVCRRIIDVISRGFRPSILPERGTLSLAYRARAIATRASEPRECIDIDWIYLSAVTFRAMLSLRCLHALSLRTHRLVLLPPSRGNCCGCKLRRVIHHTCARPLHQR